jgi:hypothetical protein
MGAEDKRQTGENHRHDNQQSQAHGNALLSTIRSVP